jgi:hypothetical protein
MERLYTLNRKVLHHERVLVGIAHPTYIFKNQIGILYADKDSRDVFGKHLHILRNLKVKLFTHPLLKPDIHLLS